MYDRGSSLLVTVGLKMKSKMKLTVLVFKMFFTDDLVELIVRETNAHAGER
jgi:hypothetical protein